MMRSGQQAPLRFTIATLVAFLAARNSAVGQWMGRQTGCYADSIAANPNRPTVSNPAHVTQYGVLELEYGWALLARRGHSPDFTWRSVEIWNVL
jgi:hypothetical protein